MSLNIETQNNAPDTGYLAAALSYEAAMTHEAVELLKMPLADVGFELQTNARQFLIKVYQEAKG